MQENEGIRTFTAGEALSVPYLRVKLSSGAVVAAGASDQDIGIALRAVASGEPVAVKLRNFPGSTAMVAAKAITAGTSVFTAASGKLSDASPAGSYPRGVALSAAAADGDEIEVLPVAGHGPVETS